jgi:hypothetical protein
MMLTNHYSILILLAVLVLIAAAGLYIGGKAISITETDLNSGSKHKTSKTIIKNEVLIQENNAIDFVFRRRNAYEEKGMLQRWHMRGVGYLYRHWDMILLAELPTEPKVGRNVVTIRNVHPSVSSNNTRNDCYLWTLYVRVNGPEIFAGSAIAINATATATQSTSSPLTDIGCYWEFPFNLSISGSYLVDAKILHYNATSYPETQCNVTSGTYTNKEQYYHKGFLGFKMYEAAEMCCEICSRLQPDCVHWATPPLLLDNPSFRQNGCELFFNDNTSQWIPVSSFMNESKYIHQRKLNEVESYHGPPNGIRPVFFAGCGWSFWMTLDYPCIDGNLDDRIYIHDTNSSFTISSGVDATVIKIRQKNLPLCAIEQELPEHHSGRWVRDVWPSQLECPDNMTYDTNRQRRFKIVKVDPERPRCWYRDDLSIVGNVCIEMNCMLIKEESKWRSALHNETHWYGSYDHYNCQYKEFTDKQLQQCIDRRKIVSFFGSGASIWQFLNEYLQLRTSHLTLYNTTSDDGLNIHLTTLSFLHIPMVVARKRIESDANVRAKGNNGTTEIYYINGNYLSSEREHRARGPTQVMKAQIAREVLESRSNYHLLNFYDMTAAFTYDSATQNDGMHIIGPPMKMIMTKLFHYVCADYIT